MGDQPNLTQNQWLVTTPKIKIRKRDSHTHTPPHPRNTCTQRVMSPRTQYAINQKRKGKRKALNKTFSFLIFLGHPQLLPNLQAWIEELYQTTTINCCYVVNHILRFVQRRSLYKNKSNWVLELILL